jgi:hypothetical protein
MTAYDALAEARDKLKTRRAQLEREAAATIDRQMHESENAFDGIVWRAVREEGNSVASVAREMGASRTTVYAILERYTPAAPLTDPLHRRYAYDPATRRLTVTLDPATLAEALAAVDLAMPTADAEARGLHRAEFGRMPAGHVVPVTPAWMADLGAEHPVKYWAAMHPMEPRTWLDTNYPDAAPAVSDDDDDEED